MGVIGSSPTIVYRLTLQVSLFHLSPGLNQDQVVWQSRRWPRQPHPLLTPQPSTSLVRRGENRACRQCAGSRLSPSARQLIQAQFLELCNSLVWNSLLNLKSSWLVSPTIVNQPHQLLSCLFIWSVSAYTSSEATVAARPLSEESYWWDILGRCTLLPSARDLGRTSPSLNPRSAL